MHCARMAQGDGFDQGQTQADTAVALGGAGQTVERLKNTLKQLRRHSRAAVTDTDHGLAIGAAQPRRDLSCRVAAGILQQVTHGSAQQFGDPLHRQVRPVHQHRV